MDKTMQAKNYGDDAQKGKSLRLVKNGYEDDIQRGKYFELVKKSVIITTLEGIYEVINLANYPVVAEMIGTNPSRTQLLRALSADIQELRTPFLKGVVTQSKDLARQGRTLESVMSRDEMDELIYFAETELGLSMSMLRATRSMVAIGRELGDRAFKRERYTDIRYLNFFREHPITESKMMDTIKFTLSMAYLDGLEVLKKDAEVLKCKIPEKLDIESGYIDEIMAIGDLRAALWQAYIRAQKCSGKAGLAGIMMPVVDRGIAKYSAINNAPHNR